MPPCLLDAPSPEAASLLPLQWPRGAGALTHARTGPGRLGKWLGRTAPGTLNRSAHQRLDSARQLPTRLERWPGPPGACSSACHHWPAVLAQPDSHWPEAAPAPVYHVLFTLSAGKSSQAAPSTPAPIGQYRVPLHPLMGLFYIIYAPGAIGQSAQACLYNECKDVFHS